MSESVNIVTHRYPGQEGWTNDLPFEPGWYWCRRPSGGNNGAVQDDMNTPWLGIVRVDRAEHYQTMLGVKGLRKVKSVGLVVTWLTEIGKADVIRMQDVERETQWLGPIEQPDHQVTIEVESRDNTIRNIESEYEGPSVDFH